MLTGRATIKVESALKSYIKYNILLKNRNLKYQRSTQFGCKDMAIRKFEFELNSSLKSKFVLHHQVAKIKGFSKT